jgi:hypothetical protein
VVPAVLRFSKKLRQPSFSRFSHSEIIMQATTPIVEIQTQSAETQQIQAGVSELSALQLALVGGGTGGIALF